MKLNEHILVAFTSTHCESKEIPSVSSGSDGPTIIIFAGHQKWKENQSDNSTRRKSLH